MTKKIFYILTCIVLVFSGGQHAQAAENPFSIRNNQADMAFPITVDFHLEATGQYPIQAATLLYGTNALSCHENVSRKEFQPAASTHVYLNWTWDLERSGALPIGAQIWWQWQLTDTQGNQWSTPRQTLTVQDTAYDWHTVQAGKITLQWVEGGAYFGNTMLDIATASLERLVNEMGIAPPTPITIAIYPDVQGVKDALIHAAEWTGGVAFPEYGSIMTGIRPNEMSWARDVLPHELAHLVVDTLTFNCQGITLPTWLSEGMAVYAEGNLSDHDQRILTKALDEGTLPPLTTLTSGFSPYPDEASRSYAHSGAVIGYLAQTFGPQELNHLLETIQQGHRVDEALQLVYGLDTYTLDRAWRAAWGYPDQLPERQSVQAPTATPIPTLALWNPLGTAATPT
ncbi:MAG: hypothetical protein D6755_01895, partial [Anaerolineae bacterium]